MFTTPLVEPKTALLTRGYCLLDEPVFSEQDFNNLRSYLFKSIEQIPPRLQPTAFSLNPYVPKQAVADWVGCDNLLKIITPILGPDIVFLQMSMCYKPPHTPHRVSLHSDAHFAAVSKNHEIGSVLNVFISITDCNSENGWIRFIPGAQEKRMYRHKQVNKEFNFFVGEVDEPGIDPSQLVGVEMKANRACLFSHSVLHDSPNNKSDYPRLGMTLRYASATTPIGKTANGPFMFMVQGKNIAGNDCLDPNTLPKVGGFSWSR